MKVISVYLRQDEYGYLIRASKKGDKKVSTYIRGLLNAERFGMDQTEMELDISKNNLPVLFRKIAELEKRVNDVENNL